MTLKFSALERWEIHIRAKAKESVVALAREYSCHERSIRRIRDKDTDELFAAAGCPDERVRIRVKAISKELTPIKKTLQATTPAPDGVKVVAGPKYISLAPLGKQIPPLELKGLPRKLGSQQRTSDYALIIMDSDGRAVRIEQCPIYRNFQMIRRGTVEITKIDGIMVEGKVRQWSGGAIHGYLVFDGVPGSGIVSRVEFHPLTLPGKYELETREFRRRSQ